MLADPATPPALKSRLERVTAIRDFASTELKLPDNQSYRSYADLQRPFVVWNVFAAAEFSIEPEQWCFLIAGCVGYRGYFAQENAETFAQELRERGLDVFVGGVPAYSTLGWFDDPVLNTFINYPDYELARLIFHELAHQVVYVKGDTEFNESFAAAVEYRGRAALDRAQRRRQDARRLRAFAAAARAIRGIGAQTSPRARRALSHETRARRDARAQGRHLRRAERGLPAAEEAEWGGFAGYDRFLDDPNNAKLASISIYNALVPQFQQLIARYNGDLAAFYAEVKRLAALDVTARELELGTAPPERVDF